jgi:hypothetical protein
MIANMVHPNEPTTIHLTKFNEKKSYSPATSNIFS